MTDTHKSAWFSAAFGVVIVLLGVTLWKVTKSPNGDVAKKLAAIDSKIEAANATLAKAQTASSAVAINNRLDSLDAKIGKIDAALTELRKGDSLKSVGEKLDALNAGIKSTDAALAGIRTSVPQTEIGSKLDAIGAGLKNINAGLADLQKSAAAQRTAADVKLAEIKQAIPPQSLSSQFAGIASQIRTINTSLADIRTAATGTAATPKPSEVVVVYLDMPKDAPMPRTVATVSPLKIQFKNIGSADDEGQAAMIVTKLTDIVKDRKDCTISVAGYADTLGGDKTNLTLSKKRARVIAAKLKTAFAGKPVQINEAAWGERRLADWTPDGTAREANRRVDVAVSCKK